MLTFLSVLYGPRGTGVVRLHFVQGGREEGGPEGRREASESKGIRRWGVCRPSPVHATVRPAASLVLAPLHVCVLAQLLGPGPALASSTAGRRLVAPVGRRHVVATQHTHVRPSGVTATERTAGLIDVRRRLSCSHGRNASVRPAAYLVLAPLHACGLALLLALRPALASSTARRRLVAGGG